MKMSIYRSVLKSCVYISLYPWPSSAKPQLLDRLTCKLYCRISALHCTVHSIQINQYDLSYSLALVHSIPPWLVLAEIDSLVHVECDDHETVWQSYARDSKSLLP